MQNIFGVRSIILDLRSFYLYGSITATHILCGCIPEIIVKAYELHDVPAEPIIIAVVFYNLCKFPYKLL